MERSKKTHRDSFTRALDYQAVPALARYEQDPSLLDTRRESLNALPSVEHCGPQFSALNLGIIQHAGALDAVIAAEEELYREYEAILRRKIGIHDVMEHDARTNSNADPNIECSLVGRPVARIGAEADLESKRIRLFQETDDRCSERTRTYLDAVDILDKDAMARHIVRQRWEAIGVWNRTWKLTTNPKANWRWPWQTEPPEQDDSGNLTLLREAIEACGAMSPGQYGKLTRDKARNQVPKQGWSRAQGDDFIGSRPWFAFEVECMVEWTRRDGVELADQQCWPTAAGDFIRRRWMDEGIWNHGWDYLEGVRDEPMVGWRWAGEGHEPDWADLEEVNWMEDTVAMLREADHVARGGPVPRRSRRIVKRRAAERRVAEAERAAAAVVAASQQSPTDPRRPTRQRRRRQRREPSRPGPTRTQAEGGGGGGGRRRTINTTEDNNNADRERERPATRRRRRG
ncbi:hypothetical protein V2A60_007451 [Cordyceps javanica]|uniref:Uncharacterized protein n=1 Tax=Cordyceps javanica TaxID=43265 RepID=A0A545VAV5_9HYPO|nr:hypothetical protein IF1G_02930 [Cordyceps javanica]TQW10062.1 hypothetical protein IF2G_02852 [Cordyceps javanica]